MGAQFEYMIFTKSKATREELQKDWDTLVSRCYHEHGHGGYSGTLKECSGMQIVNLHFPNFNEAYEWLEGNTQKWEAAKLVSFDDVETKVTQQITFNGQTSVAATKPHDLRCVTRKWNNGSPEYSYADQLTDQQKKILKCQFDKYNEVCEGYEKETRLFRALHANSWKFFDPAVTFGPEEWKEMKRLRRSLVTNKVKVDKLHVPLAERDRKYADSIIKTKTTNNGKKFVVGGWCSC